MLAVLIRPLIRPLVQTTWLHFHEVASRTVTSLDGLYRHRDTSIVWDDVGVTISRPPQATTSHVSWHQVTGVRQIGKRPGFIQLLVRDHIPPADPEDDPFSISVASDDDATRLVTSIGWRSAPQRPRQTGPRLVRRRRRSA